MGESLASTIAEQLIDLVVGGEFPPGATLPSENELAKRFNASRLTIREALSRLGNTHIIKTHHGRSSVVAPVQEWSPLHPKLLLAQGVAFGDPLLLPKRLLETRRIIEVGVAEAAATMIGRQALTTLAQHHAGMLAAHNQADGRAFAHSDLAFHNTIFIAVDNPYLTALFDPIIAVVAALREQTSAIEIIRVHALSYHGKIYEALEARDPNAAREEMRAHLLQTEHDMIELMAGTGTHPYQ